jgi:DNA-binding response OmpR family regulator
VQQPLHILLIEDDPAVGQSLRTGLEGEGYRMTLHPTGAAGMAFVRDHQPHLIILHVRLPDGSGFDVCRRYTPPTIPAAAWDWRLSARSWCGTAVT